MNSAFRRTLTPLALTAFLAGSGVSVRAQDPAPQSPPDNTKVNERDRKKSEPTADQQDNNRSDLDITKQIRESIIKDKSLSTYAHNVKIITQGGMVTLKGPVRSDAEKRSIEEKAAAVVGPSKVTSELAVKSKK
jgi:hyperosmotically inducible periplasmic protein